MTGSVAFKQKKEKDYIVQNKTYNIIFTLTANTELI